MTITARVANTIRHASLLLAGPSEKRIVGEAGGCQAAKFHGGIFEFQISDFGKRQHKRGWRRSEDWSSGQLSRT
jgi:hypothetical protein